MYENNKRYYAEREHVNGNDLNFVTSLYDQWFLDKYKASKKKSFNLNWDFMPGNWLFALILNIEGKGNRFQVISKEKEIGFRLLYQLFQLSKFWAAKSIVKWI